MSQRKHLASIHPDEIISNFCLLDWKAKNREHLYFKFECCLIKIFLYRQRLCLFTINESRFLNKGGTEPLEPKKTPLIHKEIKIRLIQIYANEHYSCIIFKVILCQ